MQVDLTRDHGALEDAHETRRYFNKFEKIIQHLTTVAERTTADETVLEQEVPIIKDYVDALANTFAALSYKYLVAGRIGGVAAKLLDIDRQESGFPIYQEVLQMASDAMQADRHLKTLPPLQKLKQDMVRHILNERSAPTDHQYAASQRLYYEYLTKNKLFWAQNDPVANWKGNDAPSRRKYLIHWAVYDSQQNIPVVYLLDVEDTGDVGLPKDQSRWPKVQSHLMAQSVGALKLLTIASGFDKDFDDLHPKRLRRFFVGPMYSHTFTQQSGPLRDVLAEAAGEPGLDWALAWTVESLTASRTEMEKVGWFGQVERQIFDLDPMSGVNTKLEGLTSQHRSLILPQRPYQVLEERRPAGFNSVRKYVVSPTGHILSQR